MTKPNIRHALSVKRADDFAQWYQEVISEADMAEESGVRGCMVIKPWGYGIWERMQKLLDAEIKATGAGAIMVTHSVAAAAMADHVLVLTRSGLQRA